MSLLQKLTSFRPDSKNQNNRTKKADQSSHCAPCRDEQPLHLFPAIVREQTVPQNLAAAAASNRPEPKPQRPVRVRTVEAMNQRSWRGRISTDVPTPRRTRSRSARLPSRAAIALRDPLTSGSGQVPGLGFQPAEQNCAEMSLSRADVELWSPS